MPADEPDAFSVPPPIFEPVPDEPSSDAPNASASGVDTTDGLEPRDPNAPPVPGTPRNPTGGSVVDSSTTRQPSTPTADERTPEEIEAEHARFRRPGARGRRTLRTLSAKRKRTATPRPPSGPAGRPATMPSTSSEASPSPAAHPSARSRGGAFLSPPALLGFSVAIALLTILLVVLIVPGSTPWAVVAALVLVGVVQLALLIGSIVVIRRGAGRRLGVLALVLLLVVNPVTASVVRGITSVAPEGGVSAGGGGDDEEHDPIWDTYPGSAYVDAEETLDGPSYEDFVTTSDAMLADIRTALTAEFGFDWVERQPAETEADQNGYGGDSMLVEYTAPVWQTTTTVRTFEEKSRVVELIRQVLLRYGIANLDMQNAPSSWREPGELTERYGGETIDTQALWDLHTYDAITGGGTFQASIVDLTLDSAGTVAKDREFDVTQYGMAAEGIELHVDSYALLKEADRADYLEALKPYAGLDKPK